MRIFSLIGGNARRAPETLRVPERHVPAPGFRGLVRNDAARCLGCGTCTYVCVSRAIAVIDHDDHCDWDYDPGRCTFCGRCVDTCPGEALTQDPDRAPVYSSPAELHEMVRVDYPRCPRCGRPARPLGDRLHALAFASPGDELGRLTLLCDRCRRRRAQDVLRPGPRADADRVAAPAVRTYGSGDVQGDDHGT